MIGLVGGLVVATPVSALLRSAGWPLVVGVAAGAVLATAASYVVGVTLGPDAPASVPGARPGSQVAAPLTVHTQAVLLTWLVGALAGLVVGVWLTDRSRG